MHPILASRTAIVLYLSIWVPIGCVLGFLLSVTGGMSWRESAAITAPLTLVYAFICMSAWYSCKYLPLGATAAGRLAMNQGAAAVAAALLWIVIAKGLALGLSREFAGVDLRLSREIPLLFAVGIGLYALAAAVHYAALSLEASRSAGQREREARALAGEAELRALKAQINPHFLFNSLNSISALTTVDGARAREMCIKLSDFLRRTLSLGDRETIPLSEEVALTMMYLSVEQVRFGKRLRFEQRFDPGCGECAVPPLILQPLVENAVKHGIAGLVEGGEIALSVEFQAGKLRIAIENDYDPEARAASRNGIGLENVKARVRARFPEESLVRTEAGAGRFRVELMMPCRTRERG